jgi:hypothetical protein
MERVCLCLSIGCKPAGVSGVAALNIFSIGAKARRYDFQPNNVHLNSKNCSVEHRNGAYMVSCFAECQYASVADQYGIEDNFSCFKKFHFVDNMVN